jgi:hypothetical protein
VVRSQTSCSSLLTSAARVELASLKLPAFAIMLLLLVLLLLFVFETPEPVRGFPFLCCCWAARS